MPGLFSTARSVVARGTGCLAVILIDMQDGFLGALWGKKRDELIGAQVRVLEYCTKNDVPVFVLEYRHHGKTVEELRRSLGRVPRVHTIPKSFDDGFDRTDLDQQLRAVGAGHLLLMGINASFCVYDTARSARKLGYSLITATSLILDVNTRMTMRRAYRWYRVNGIMTDDVHAALTN